MEPERSLIQSIEELRDDLKGFIETRYAILRAELTSSLKKISGAAVLFAAAAVFGGLGLIFLGVCVALAIALAFGDFTNQVGLIWGFLCAGGGNLLLAAMLAGAGKKYLKAVNLKPDRTLRVLRRDQEAVREGGRPDVEPTSARRRA